MAQLVVNYMYEPLRTANSTRDSSWGKGGRCVMLTTYHTRSAEHQESPGP